MYCKNFGLYFISCSRCDITFRTRRSKFFGSQGNLQRMISSLFHRPGGGPSYVSSLGISISANGGWEKCVRFPQRHFKVIYSDKRSDGEFSINRNDKPMREKDRKSGLSSLQRQPQLLILPEPSSWIIRQIFSSFDGIFKLLDAHICSPGVQVSRII